MIRFIISIYILCIIIDAIASYFPQLKTISFFKYLRKISEVTEGPIRKYLPRDIPIDLSPLIVIVILMLLKALW